MHLSNSEPKAPRVNKEPHKASSSLLRYMCDGTEGRKRLTIILQSSPACDKAGGVGWKNMRGLRETYTVYVTCELDRRGQLHHCHIILVIQCEVTVVLMNNDSSDKSPLFWRPQHNPKAGSPPARLPSSARQWRLHHSHANTRSPKGA